jgi:hypothetical protein
VSMAPILHGPGDRAKTKLRISHNHLGSRDFSPVHVSVSIARHPVPLVQEEATWADACEVARNNV